MDIRDKRSDKRALLEKAKEIFEQKALGIQKGSTEYIRAISIIKKEMKETQTSKDKK
jgi:hypothetical protein